MPQAALPKQLKAQASVELLLISAAFLAFLAVWVPSISSIMAQGKQAIALSYAELALSDLVGAGEELRILGNGNSRELLMRMPCDAGVEFSGERAVMLARGAELARPIRFSSSSILRLSAGLNRVNVENRNGEITYSATACISAPAPS